MPVKTQIRLQLKEQFDQGPLYQMNLLEFQDKYSDYSV